MFKKCHKWTNEEENILKLFFYDLPFSTHNKQTRFNYLLTKLKEFGFNTSDLTEKAISRKTYRLGLKSIEVKNEDKHKVKCSGCNCDLIRPKRYKKGLCSICEEKLKHRINDLDRHKLYHRTYIKQWRLKNV